MMYNQVRLYIKKMYQSIFSYVPYTIIPIQLLILKACSSSVIVVAKYKPPLQQYFCDDNSGIQGCLLR